MTPLALDVRELAVAVAGHEALSEVTLQVHRGSSLGLVGETGCGKTMTCRSLLGLERRIGASILRGQITLEGQELTGLSEERWREIRGRRIALVPQASLSAMDPLMKVGAQLEETIRAHDPAHRPGPRALELAEQVDLPDPAGTLRRYPHELSGGMRQRVMIALALTGRPSLLIADEPTTALDVTVQRRILRLLQRIRAETGMSLIFVSHDLAVVRAISDHVTIMYAGSTVETGPVEQIFTRPAHPYTRALIAAQPGLNEAGGPLAAISGTPPQPASRPSGCPFRTRCPIAIDRCSEEMPPAADLGRDHSARCWRANEDRQ